MYINFNFNDFLNEFNRQDKIFIESLSDYFTLSIEYELVADFPIEEEPSIDTETQLNNAKKYAKEQTLLDMSRGKFGYKFEEQFKLSKSKLKDNERKMEEENDLTKIGKARLEQLHLKYLTWTYVNKILNSVLDLIELEDDEDDYIKKINKYQKRFEDDMTNYIINTLDKNIIKFIFEQNMQNLKDEMKKYLPNFTKKWAKTFKYELEADADKQRILEFSSKTYLKGLNQCFEQLNDFYNEFEKQDFWKMNNRTALHVNIGVVDKNIRWNPIKGLLLMRDMNRSKKTPFVFSNIMWRLNNRFTQSLLDGIRRNLTGEIEMDYIRSPKFTEMEEKAIKKEEDLGSYIIRQFDKKKITEQEYNDLMSELTLKYNLGFRHKERLEKHKEYIQQNIDKLDLHNIKQVENFINEFLIKANSDFYIKEFGIKLVELENVPGYVEFRYVGGNVGRELFIDKILYFCYIIYLMTNDDYKREDYHKKLYRYVEELKKIISE
jgi:hypothetical protein